MPVKRKLTAILAADYSRLMARDEVGTLARLRASRGIVDALIASHGGRIFNIAGDSIVADFATGCRQPAEADQRGQRFPNIYLAHHDKPLTDPALAERNLKI